MLTRCEREKSDSYGNLLLIDWFWDSYFFLRSAREFYCLYTISEGSPGGSAGKSLPGDVGLIPGSGRSPGEGNGNPLQYSCLENPMERGAWRATVHGVTKSQTRLID